MLGAPFQPVYPNPITQIPTITATADPSNPRPVFNQLYTLSAGFGEVITYPGRRGVPTPRVILEKTDERYLVFGVNFPYQMSGTDHFVFTFTSQNTGEQIIKNFQPAPQYIVGGILPGVLYTLTVAPVVNGITYPGSAPPLGPLTITAVSAKNVQLQGVTLSGGDTRAFIKWVNAIPQPPIAFEVTTVAVDDNFGTPQRLLKVIPTYPPPPSGQRPTNYSGYVQITNLINGSAYTFTITPYQETDGIFEYGRPTTLPPYIPGPPSDLVITGISADGSLNTVTLNVSYDTTVHPVPESVNVSVYKSTFTTLCSLVGQSTTVVQDLSQTYASFTTSTGFFTASGFASIVSTVSSAPGSIQVDLLNDKGYFYTFPLTDVSTGGLGYTFGNSNFVKTTNLISTASSYSVLFRSVSLGFPPTPYISGIGQTVLTISSLPRGLYTFVGSNYANGLYSRVSTYTTIAGSNPSQPQAITGGILSGNQFVSLAFSGYDPTDIYPRPTSYLYTENSTGKTYTSITSNILIGGLVNGTTYTFGIQGFGNGMYGPSGQFSVTPTPQPPINLSASISNYDVTISFAPGLGGADFYQITNQSGQTVGLSGGLYKFLNLSANVAYTFRGKSFVYGSPVYTLTSTNPSSSIVEISSAYAQFLVSPSVTTLSYASTMIANIQYFVPYNYTISGGGTTYSFPITSMTPVYDASATLLWYNIANTNVAKAAATFSGATTYTTTLSTTVPLFAGMEPTTSSGTTISSAFSLPTSPSAYVGPPTTFYVTVSLASSQRVDITVENYGFVVPSRYNYTEISGKIAPGFSLSANIVIDNLTNGSSYTFTISAFGNQVYSTTNVSAGPFLLSTAAPSNAVANFNNTTATVDFSTYTGTGITYFGEIIENGYPGTVKQTLSQIYSPFVFNPSGINAGTKYGFRVYGIQNNIVSVNEIVNPIIAGPPLTPKNIVSTLSNNQITFNWSTGNAAYSEMYTITEYLSNNGICNATGLVTSGLSSQTYTISSVITASGTQVFDSGYWLETTPGYASFVLQNVTNFTDIPIGSRYSSNQIYLTLQQSGLTYTFPLSTVTPFGTGSNTYANTAYPKEQANIFNPLLSISVTYSYGTGPRNGGTYSYAFTSLANQVPSAPSNVGVNMFVQPVLGIPSVSVTGTAATISFAQTNPPGTVYRVTNNYGATVSRAPYTFTNLSVGTSFPYTFSVVASNGVFVSVSSELSPPVYAGPPPIPLVGASYFGQVASVTAIDTTISLTAVFYDTGTQNTGSNVWTVSHGNVIQTSSGGFWVATLPDGYGSIKDSAIGFVATTPSSYAMYSNDGYSNARYQFTVTPSTGTITATLSAYSLIISGSSLTVTNAGVRAYSGTTLSPSYTVQFYSYSNGFGIQSGAAGGNSLLYYSQVPAYSDSMEFTITDPASFSNFQASRIQNVGPATVSYGIVDQFRTVYNPSLQFATYTPSGLQYAYSIVNIPYAITLSLNVTPYANNVSGPTGSVDIFLFTGAPGTPQVSINNTTATVVVPKVAIGSVDTYFLDIITGGSIISTLSAVATASPTYTFQRPGLISHSNYFFSAYATYNGVQTTTGPVTVGPYEAGIPYSNADFPGLLEASIGNPSAATGTYTISALVNPGKNSNAAITTSVYRGPTFVTSQTFNTSQQQVFSFTVSSGLVYTLTTTAFMNGFTANSGNPSITLSANPFPPSAVALTISSANIGVTYSGAITITASSATPNVITIYGYVKDGISTSINTGNTFTAVYNSSYTGYAYTTIGTLSSSITYSTVCNVSLSTPTNVQVDYDSTNITLTWSGATNQDTNYYTVVASNTTTAVSTISQNIPWGPSKTYLFSGAVGNNYTFTVRGQSQRNPSASLIYSAPVSASVSLSTQSVNPSADYSGTKITVSFSIANLTTSSQYTFGVTCVCGSVTNPNTYPNNSLYASTYGFTASGLGQILRFAVQPLLKGIPGPVTYTNTVNLTASALTNISQSYTGTIYTISWTPINISGYNYIIRDVSGNVTPQTISTSASSSTQFTLSYGSSYQFQALAEYNGIQSVVSTLSRIYTYTLSSLGVPTTDYTGRNITVSWSAAQQVDLNYATSYILRNVCGNPVMDTTVVGATTSSFVGIPGSTYRYTVTAVYNGISSSPSSPGDQIGLYTNPPTNVKVTNSGQNIVVTWSGSSWPPASQATIFYTLSQIGNGTLTAGSDGSGRFTTSATVYAPATSLPISSNAFYNYVITASAKGFTSSPFASATVSGLVFTYAPTNVVFVYSGDDTRTSHIITSTQPANQKITPYVSWANTTAQSSTAVYTVSLVDITISAKSPPNSGFTQPGINYWTNPSITYPTINLAGDNYGHSVVPYVYATNNGLASETVSGQAVRVYTAPPGVVGVGFDGLYRITFSLCRGATDDIPDYYTIWERNDAYKTNTGSGDYPLSYFTVSYQALNTIYTIPLTGIQGYTYDFAIYATRFGVVSTLNTTQSSYTLETTPVTDTSTSVSYSGTTITFSWSEAKQQIFDGTTSAPNVGYTIYVTPGNPFVPLVNAYKNRLSYNFTGTPGQSYYFTILAVNNNITSSPTQSDIVTLYQPVVTDLEGTNTCENDRDVSMILTWTPDILNASGAQYRAVSFNQSTGATVTSNNIGINSSTVTFTGSIGVAYTFFVQGIYNGISGLAQSVEISNARPRITSFSLTNLGNNIFAQYTVTPVGSIVTLSAYSTTSGSVVTSISYTSDTTATLTVSSSTGSGQNYSISATARYVGIPSTVCGKTYSMIQPAKPGSFSAGYNNALVSVSWASATNASSYTFIAYDLSTNQQADIQSYIPQTFTTFIGTLGHSYSLSVTAFSATYIPSVTASASVAIAIPSAPTGLSLCNAGALVTVGWTADPSAYSRYSYTVVNASSQGTIFYQSSPFVSSGDTFLATVGQTFRVSLFGTSLCNVTSTSSTVSSLFIYQPSIPSVTATSVGADITLTFPGDARETCEYLVQDNYAYTILLYSPSGFSSDKYTQTLSAKYTESANGFISYTILNNSYNLNGTQYQYTVTPYYRLVPGTPVLTSGVNPLTLYKPTTPGQFTVTNQGSDLLLNWQSSAIGTIPVPTLVPNYRVDVKQVTVSGSYPTAVSPQYVTGTSATFTGYDSGAGQLSISVTAIIPGYDQNLSATYINGFTSNKNYTIPNQTSISIKQTDCNNPQNLSVTIPPMAAEFLWFFTTATGVTPILGPTPFQSKNYTVISNTDPTGTIFQTCNVTVSTGLYYTISAYGWVNGTTFPGPASAIAVAKANPNPYPATTFNVSYASIRTSHSGTIITVSWAPVTQAAYYDVQEFNSENVKIGGGGLLLPSPSWESTATHTAGSSYRFEITAFTISQANFAGGVITGQAVDGLPVGANLPNSKNPYFPTQTSPNETLYIPGSVVNLTPVQFLQSVSLTWSQPNIWTPQTSITTTSRDTTYFIQQLSGTTTTVIASKTISGGGNPQTSFDISAGRTYTFSVSTTYYGIATTTPTSTSLVTVNPSITALTLTDNGNRTLTLSGSANTAGNWYANISTGSTASFAGGTTICNFTIPTTATGTTYTLAIPITSGTITVNGAGGGAGGSTLSGGTGGSGGSGGKAVFTLGALPAGTIFTVIVGNKGGTGNSSSSGGAGGAGGVPGGGSAGNGNTNFGGAGGGGGYSVVQFTSNGTVITISAGGGAGGNGGVGAGNYVTGANGGGGSIGGAGAFGGGGGASGGSGSFAGPTGTTGTNGGGSGSGQNGSVAFSITTLLATPVSTNTTSFTLDQTVTAGSAWTGFAQFVATLGGLTVSANTAQITLPNPTITGCTISDNLTDGTLTLNLLATIGGSGSYTPRWTVPTTVGTLTLFTSPANSASTTAVYKKALAAQTYSFTGITVSADGFQSSASSASFTTPTFTVSQNPLTITMASPKTLNAFFFSPELTNVGPPRTLSTSLTLSSTISWNFSTGLTNGGTFSSYAPSTGSGIVSVSYTNVGVNTTVSFPANSVSVNYQGYTVSLGSAVSYATPNPTVTVGSTATRFVDNNNGTLTLFLVAAGCTQGSGNVTWSVPSPISGSPSGSITVSGSPGTVASTSVVYTGTTHGSTYTIAAGGVTVNYTGYSNSNATSIASPQVQLPQINAISGVYFGCSEDRALTGADSITVSVSSSLPSTWTITACSALTLNSSSGQGTTAIQWIFSGGLKTRAYTFTVGTCNVTVSLTKPSANVTPSFSNFVNATAPTGVTTSIANRSGSTFVFLGTTNATDTAATIALNTQSTLTTGIYTVSAAAVSNGVLGTISSYQFAICPQVTGAIKWGSASNVDDHTLAGLNTTYISFTKPTTDTQFTYALYSTTSTTSPGRWNTTDPTDVTFITSTTQSFFIPTLTTGSKKYFVSTLFDNRSKGGTYFLSPGSSIISFSYREAGAGADIDTYAGTGDPNLQLSTYNPASGFRSFASTTLNTTHLSSFNFKDGNQPTYAAFNPPFGSGFIEIELWGGGGGGGIGNGYDRAAGGGGGSGYIPKTTFRYTNSGNSTNGGMNAASYTLICSTGGGGIPFYGNVGAGDYSHGGCPTMVYFFNTDTLYYAHGGGMGGPILVGGDGTSKPVGGNLGQFQAPTGVNFGPAGRGAGATQVGNNGNGGFGGGASSMQGGVAAPSIFITGANGSQPSGNSSQFGGFFGGTGGNSGWGGGGGNQEQSGKPPQNGVPGDAGGGGSGGGEREGVTSGGSGGSGGIRFRFWTIT